MESVVVGSLQRVDPRLVRVWAIPLIALEVLVGVAAVAILAVLGFGLLAGAVAALAALAAVWTYDLVRRTWARWGYVLGMDALEVHHGLVVQRRSVVPYHRIQQVDLERGPIDRWLGLTTVVLRTAAATTDGRIPAVAETEAERIRVQLLTRAGHGDAV